LCHDLIKIGTQAFVFGQPDWHAMLGGLFKLFLRIDPALKENSVEKISKKSKVVRGGGGAYELMAKSVQRRKKGRG